MGGCASKPKADIDVAQQPKPFRSADSIAAPCPPTQNKEVVVTKEIVEEELKNENPNEQVKADENSRSLENLFKENEGKDSNEDDKPNAEKVLTEPVKEGKLELENAADRTIVPEAEKIETTKTEQNPVPAVVASEMVAKEKPIEQFHVPAVVLKTEKPIEVAPTVAVESQKLEEPEEKKTNGAITPKVILTEITPAVESVNVDKIEEKKPVEVATVSITAKAIDVSTVSPTPQPADVATVSQTIKAVEVSKVSSATPAPKPIEDAKVSPMTPVAKPVEVANVSSTAPAKKAVAVEASLAAPAAKAVEASSAAPAPAAKAVEVVVASPTAPASKVEVVAASPASPTTKAVEVAKASPVTQVAKKPVEVAKVSPTIPAAKPVEVVAKVSPTPLAKPDEIVAKVPPTTPTAKPVAKVAPTTPAEKPVAIVAEVPTTPAAKPVEAATVSAATPTALASKPVEVASSVEAQKHEGIAVAFDVKAVEKASNVDVRQEGPALPVSTTEKVAQEVPVPK